MNESAKVRVLLILMFMSCCATALCLGMLTYTVATGELPFNLEIASKFKVDTPKVQPKYKVAPLPIEMRTPDELTLRELDDELKSKLKSLELRESQVEQANVAAKQLIDNADEIRKKTEMALEAIKKEREEKVAAIKRETESLEVARKKFAEIQVSEDAKILKKIAETIAQMRPTTSMILLTDLDVPQAARLLNEMTDASRSEILATMIEVTEIEGRKLSAVEKSGLRRKANEIILEIRQIKDKIGAAKP